MTRATTPQPLWLHGGERPPTDRFLYDSPGNCLGNGEYYFTPLPPAIPDPTNQVIAMNLCRTCPLFRPCTRWALYGDCDDRWDDGIVAGMTPETRRRIRSGEEPWVDWRKNFDYSARMARAVKRKRLAEGLSKRDQRQAEMPACPGCGSNQCVIREGRNKFHNRQRYQCTACGPMTFLGEEL